MDSKKVIEKLIKIAENQQKIIMKLVNAQDLPPDALPNSQVSFEGGKAAPPTSQPPPTALDPNKAVKQPNVVFYNAMNDAQKGLLAFAPTFDSRGINIKFKPGKATQANYDNLMALLQSLTGSGKPLQQSYKLNAS